MLIENTNKTNSNINVKRIKINLRSLCDGGLSTKYVADYAAFYGFKNSTDSQIKFYIGTFSSGGKNLTAYILKPQKYKATVILLHGYLNHSGLMRRMAEYLLEHGYAVVMFDLPGHGLSEGKRASIDDFSQYGCALSDFLAVIENHVRGPYHIVAHSTGASAVLEHIFTNLDNKLSKIVLIAPLIKCRLNRPSDFINWSLGPDSAVQRIFKNSSNRDYFFFIWFKDPLQARNSSIKWFIAMKCWHKRLFEYSPLNRNIIIIQGDRDMTVDWRYNIGFIRGKFAATDVTMIRDGNHKLLNESDDVSSKVYECIKEYLQD